MRIIKFLAVVAIGMMAAGCGAVNTNNADSGQAPAATVTCILGAQGADVEVTITNQASCAGDIRSLASLGLTWYPIQRLVPPGGNGTAGGESMGVTCVLHKGGSTLTVEDAGGMDCGNQICSSSEQQGGLPA